MKLTVFRSVKKRPEREKKAFQKKRAFNRSPPQEIAEFLMHGFRRRLWRGAVCQRFVYWSCGAVDQ
jgi:hypothetical protein